MDRVKDLPPSKIAVERFSLELGEAVSRIFLTKETPTTFTKGGGGGRQPVLLGYL